MRSIADEVPNDQRVVHVDPESGQVMLNSTVGDLLANGGLLQFAAGQVAQADVEVQFGPAKLDTDGAWSVDANPALRFAAHPDVTPEAGEAPDPAIRPAVAFAGRANGQEDWGVEVRLSNPYTSRATTLVSINGLLLVMAAAAFVAAVLMAVFLAGRFATPITRLTEASRRLAEGDLSSRVATDDVSSSTLELRALSRQFNQMADRLEESVGIIRRDRDRSRDFLADVSHELLTPIAAMRTFVELLQGPAGRDPAARLEFLGSSAAQLDRLDWLAQNLLELSKLDSGLVLLDLRPEDVRGTIESAVEQQLATAERKGIGRDRRAARAPAADPPRRAARRPGRVEPRRQRAQVHRPRRPGAGDREARARRRCPDRGRGHGRRHPAVRAAADLRPLLPGLGDDRGTERGLRPRPRDRQVDRGHAPRDGRRGEPRRDRDRGSSSRSPATRARSPRSSRRSPTRPMPSPPSSRPRSRWRRPARRTWTFLHQLPTRP